MKKTKTFGKANDKFKAFKDEFTLAQLIQNVAARKMTSTQGTLYRDRKGHPLAVPVGINERRIARLGGGMLRKPPEGATCACAMGAQALTPKIANPIRSTMAVTANDNGDGEGGYVAIEKYADQRSYDIGAAYEQALRPD